MSDNAVERYDPTQALKPVTLTASALSYLQQKIAKRGKGIGLQLGTKKSGCSGYRYVVDYVDEVDAELEQFATEDPDLTVFVSKKDWPLVSGTVIDLEEQGVNRVYVYRNPQEDSSCGCGESFSVTLPSASAK